MEPNNKNFTTTEEYQRRRLELNREINSHPVKIDYACFQKTQAERDLLKVAKAAYKKMKADEALLPVE